MFKFIVFFYGSLKFDFLKKEVNCIFLQFNKKWFDINYVLILGFIYGKIKVRYILNMYIYVLFLIISNIFEIYL